LDPDLPLIKALQAGDDSALNELINRHRKALFSFVFRYLRDETVARDVVQETFVRVYFKASRYNPTGLVKTWLYTIALNLARDEARRFAKRNRHVPFDPSPNDVRPELTDSQAAPDERAGQNDEFERLQTAIQQLPEKLRDALVLFALEGKSQQEAAAILGTTAKTVELRVYHAKQKLRDWLGIGRSTENRK
jgi:RNA polymerase sigma factor CnrH